MEGRGQVRLPHAAITAADAAAKALQLCGRIRAAAADVPTCRRDCRWVGYLGRGMQAGIVVGMHMSLWSLSPSAAPLDCSTAHAALNPHLPPAPISTHHSCLSLCLLPPAPTGHWPALLAR